MTTNQRKETAKGRQVSESHAIDVETTGFWDSGAIGIVWISDSVKQGVYAQSTLCDAYKILECCRGCVVVTEYSTT
eukprot:5018370-Amphidinium_carterae.2